MFLNIEDIDTNDPESYRVQNEEGRKNRHDKVKHTLACIIILPYILLLIGQSIWTYTIPEAYENLALIIIGYYFAKFI